jgi:TatD DNase family protein
MSSVESRPIFVDTHAHLTDDQFAGDVDRVIERAAAAGVLTVVNVAYSARMWGAAAALSGQHPGVWYTIGVHPNSAGEWSTQTRRALEETLASAALVAIGETGLDYHWDTVPREAQLSAFAEQVAIAREADLPVIIHMRGDVEEDIRRVLGPHHIPLCVFHSFDGSAELAAWIIDRGGMIGVGGLMTRRSARRLQDILCSVSERHLLLETDSPYLAPTGWPERRNTPEAIPIVASHLARVRETTVEHIAAVTTENARRVFRGRSDRAGSGHEHRWAESGAAQS